MDVVTIVGIVIGISVILILWTTIENHIFTVTSYQLTEEKLPKEFDEVKLMYLVDLHNTSYGRENRRLKAAIEKQKPDYVLVGGDFLSKPDDNFVAAMDLLSFLAKRYPVYFVNGNHETKMKQYPEKYQGLYQDFYTMFTGLGIKPLSNESVVLTRGAAHIRLHGLELDESYYKRGREKPLTKQVMVRALGQCSHKEYHILLAHTPNYFECYADWGADLTLAGHNHGGMARIPGVCGVLSTQARLFPPYTKGLYQIASHKMLVSAGLGSHTIKVRFFNPPEVVMVTLQSGQEK